METGQTTPNCANMCQNNKIACTSIRLDSNEGTLMAGARDTIEGDLGIGEGNVALLSSLI
jgi:hypothetical protein